MTIGASILLIAIGLILALAIDVAPTPTAGLSIQWDAVGWILVLAGVLGLVLGLYLTRRRTGTRTDDVVAPPTRTTTVVEDERYPPLR